MHLILTLILVVSLGFLILFLIVHLLVSLINDHGLLIWLVHVYICLGSKCLVLANFHLQVERVCILHLLILSCVTPCPVHFTNAHTDT